MGEALKALGYHPFAGMAHNYFHDNRWPLWDEAIEARYNGKVKPFTKEDFEKFLGRYDAVSGWSAAILAEDLIAAYPDAKVVLTTRDPDKWVESWDGTVVTIHKWWQKWWWIPPLCGGKERDFRHNAELSLHAWSYGNPFDRSEQKRIYINHNQRVRELVSKEQLLEFDTTGGWEPLCKFLGKEVPKDQPYPHAANRQQFHKAMNMLWRWALLKALVRLAIGLGFSGLAVLMVSRYWRSRGVNQLMARMRRTR